MDRPIVSGKLSSMLSDVQDFPVVATAEIPEHESTREAPGNYEDQLRHAILENDAEEARALIESEVDPRSEYHDGDGLGFLHLAAHHEAYAIAELLLGSDADPNVRTLNDGRGYMPLHLTCKFGGEGLAQQLLDAGAQVDGVTEHGHTPLHLAVQKGLVELVDLLLAKGASVDLKNNKDLGVIDLAAQAHARVPAQYYAAHAAHNRNASPSQRRPVKKNFTLTPGVTLAPVETQDSANGSHAASSATGPGAAASSGQSSLG